MAVDQSNKSTNMFDTSLNLYRRTLKRFRPAHVALHWLMSHTLIPLLERVQNFHTMPDDPFWFRLELLTGQHEPGTTRQIRRLAQPGMVMLDVGAHVGYYSRMCASAVGNDGCVVAFEPHPRNHQILRQNTARFINMHYQPVAVAEGEGTAELYDYLMMSASGSLHYDESLLDLQKVSLNGIAPRNTGSFQAQTFSVRTRAIDDCLADLGIERVDLIKMDIEGAEMGALRGMSRTITRSPRLYLVMEYNPLGLQAFDNDPIESVQEVLAMGFNTVHVIQPDGNLVDYTGDSAALHQLTDHLMSHMGVVNLLFTRDTP